MAGKSTSTQTEEVVPITLHELYGSLQDKLRQTMKRSLNVGNQSLARRLDDVLLRQRFWEHDIHLKDGALSDLEASDTVASSIFRRYLNEIERSLSEMNAVWDDDTNDERMSLISESNISMCGKVEIFDAIAAIGAVDAVGNDRKSTAIGQLRRHLELENLKLRSLSRKKPLGDKTLRLLYPPENVHRQAILDVVAVHSFNSEHKAAEQHALDTWRKPAGDNGRFWLRDDLPGAIPQARIFLYEYDSIQAFYMKDHFVSTANNLLESIESIRQEDSCSPLLFIAYGLGGLLVLQALVSAFRSAIYDVIHDSTVGIFIFDSVDESLGFAVKTREAAAEIVSERPWHIQRIIDDANLFEEISEGRFLRRDVSTVFFISMGMWPDWSNDSYFSRIRKSSVIELYAAANKLCRFDWSEHDQANLDIVISKIKDLYESGIKAPLSKMTGGFNPSENEESVGGDLGSSSSAKTQTTKAAGSKEPSGHSPGSSSSTKTHNPKASVSKSPYEEIGFQSGFSLFDGI